MSAVSAPLPVKAVEIVQVSAASMSALMVKLTQWVVVCSAALPICLFVHVPFDVTMLRVALVVADKLVISTIAVMVYFPATGAVKVLVPSKSLPWSYSSFAHTTV